ncbi:hypothetical protein EVAR_94895_1 [Eumeta japonica]|uniref:Uncharacterized protein n=1 Tax=Eumeta variegata TaxID=151549 RepID=A0A4C1VBW6_EUMVA|nr:hypothetical protein EVAR_94895_1 [Eumeta japonica]
MENVQKISKPYLDDTKLKMTAIPNIEDDHRKRWLHSKIRLQGRDELEIDNQCVEDFSFPIHEREPAVQHLAVHLENGQRVYFTKDSARKIASEPPQNTLTAFFQLCQTDPFAKTLLYVDVPIYYTWDKTRKIFNDENKECQKRVIQK